MAIVMREELDRRRTIKHGLALDSGEFVPADHLNFKFAEDDIDAAILANRQLAEEVMSAPMPWRDPEPDSTPAQRAARRDVFDPFLEHPLACAVALVALVVLLAAGVL
jgi:hypothetical protein